MEAAVRSGEPLSPETLEALGRDKGRDRDTGTPESSSSKEDRKQRR